MRNDNQSRAQGAPRQGAVGSRRDLLKAAGFAMAASQAYGEPPQTSVTPADWLKTCRALICEAYNPPFYPSFDYKAERAVSIADGMFYQKPEKAQ